MENVEELKFQFVLSRMAELYHQKINQSMMCAYWNVLKKHTLTEITAVCTAYIYH